MNQVKLGPLLAGQPGMLLFRHETPRHQPRHELRAINGNRPAGVAWRTREGGFGCPETALPMDASINHAVAPATRVPAPPSPAIRLSRAALAATKTHAAPLKHRLQPLTSLSDNTPNHSHPKLSRTVSQNRTCPCIMSACAGSRGQTPNPKIQIPNKLQTSNSNARRSADSLVRVFLSGREARTSCVGRAFRGLQSRRDDCKQPSD